MSYRLLVKSIEKGTAHRAGPMNPALLQRQGDVELDPGRPWSGDLYDEGPVTDPAEAYIRFTGGEDVEAWLDQNPDGTLIGWVRDGNDIFRYTDADAWGEDVDGAELAPAGGEAGDAAAADPAAVEPADTDPAEEVQPEIGADPQETPDAPEGFNAEDDPATQTTDPTDGLEDPSRLPTDEEQTERETNPFDGVGDEDAVLDEEQELDAEADAEQAEEEQAEEEGAEPTDEDDDSEDDEAKKKAKKRRILGGRVEMKHLPGQHNQDDHGNWSDHIPNVHAPDTGGGSAPKGREAAPARLTPESIKHLSDEDLAAITESKDLYDIDTMIAAATELDERDDLHDRVSGLVGDAAPGSPDEAAAFDSIIPSAWVAWAGRGAKGTRPTATRREQIEDAWDAHWRALMVRASEATRGVLTKRGVTTESLAKAHFTTEDLFNGRMNRAAVNKYASEELLRFFATEHNQHLSFRDWLAEFYPSYAKRLRALGSSYFSEHG